MAQQVQTREVTQALLRPEVSELIWSDPARLGGTPCFVDTRVPIKNLFDYVDGGETLDTFLENFPSVKRVAAESIMNMGRAELLHELSIAIVKTYRSISG